MMHIMRGLGHIHHLLKAKTKHTHTKEAERGRAQKKRNGGKTIGRLGEEQDIWNVEELEG